MTFGLGVVGLIVVFILGLPIFAAFYLFNLVEAYALMGPAGLTLFAASIVDTVTSYALLSVPLFILMGELLFRSGAIAVLFEAVDNIIGRVRGRQYIIVLAVSVGLGALSGSAVAVAALLGRTLLPEATRRGGDRKLLIGLVLGGSCLATIIPPSVLIVLIGMLSGTSIAALLLAGILPGLLASVLFYIFLEFRLRAGTVEASESSERKQPVWNSLLSLLPFSLVIFAVTGLIFLGVATPTEAAACGVFGALMVAAIYRKLSLRMVIESLEGALAISTAILIIMASSKLLTQLMAFSGVTVSLVQQIASLDLPSDVAFWLMMLLVFVLCMFLDQIALMLILIPIYNPLIVHFQFEPVVFWTIMLLNLTLGAITPPFGYSLFALKIAMPLQISIGDIYRAAWPFIFLLILTMAITWYVPGLATAFVAK